MANREQLEAEPRLDFSQVNDQISRIFFGGKPEAPPVYNPGYGGSPSVPYFNYNNDIELTMKLGQVALIAFIVLVIVVVVFLLLLCCLYCPALFGGRHTGEQHDVIPYQQQSQQYAPEQPVQEKGANQSSPDVWNRPESTTSTSSESFLQENTANAATGNGNRKFAAMMTHGNSSPHSTGEAKRIKQPYWPIRNKRSTLQVEIQQPVKQVYHQQQSSSDSATSQSNLRSVPYYEVPSNNRNLKSANSVGLPEGRPPNDPAPLPPVPVHGHQFQQSGYTNQPIRTRIV